MLPHCQWPQPKEKNMHLDDKSIEMSFFKNWGWGASSNFQKYRLMFTNKGDMGPLDSHSLQKMMVTFSGKDPETRDEIGLATIVRKFHDSDSNNSWVYLLKNLVILDSALEQGFFVEELAELQLPTVFEFKTVEKNYLPFNLDSVIKKYFKLIKFKATTMNLKSSIFKAPLYQRQELTKTLNIFEVIWHFDQCEQLFTQVFEIVQFKTYKIVQFEAVKYLFLMLKNKLMVAYSVEMLCIDHILSELDTLEEQEIQQFRKRVLKFNMNAGYSIAFFEEHKDIKGFEDLNYKEFNFNCQEVVSYVDEVLKMVQPKTDIPKHIHTEELVTEEKLTIVKKMQVDNQGKLVPRFEFQPEKKPKKVVFEAFFNTYSEDFPPRELINVEVAQVLKSPKEDLSDEDEENLALERSNVLSVYNVEPIGQPSSEHKQGWLEYREIAPGKCEFSNIYSGLQPQWVQ